MLNSNYVRTAGCEIQLYVGNSRHKIEFSIVRINFCKKKREI